MEHKVQVTQEFIDPFFFNKMRRGELVIGHVRNNKIYVSDSAAISKTTEFKLLEAPPAPLPPMVELKIINRNVYIVYTGITPTPIDF